MGMRKRRGRLRRDPVFRVLRLFEDLQGAWITANAGFERREALAVDGKQWTVIYKLHVIRSEGDSAGKVDLKSSITLWPPTAPKRKVADGSKDGWDANLLKQHWYQTCQRQLRRYGYRGRWQPSPVGRFGDFWKTLRDAKTAAKELKLLDRVRL